MPTQPSTPTPPTTPRRRAARQPLTSELPPVAPDISGVTVPRFPILDVSPVVAAGTLPAKAVVGEPVPVRATVVRDGHDALGVTAVITSPDGREISARMKPLNDGLEGWGASVRPDAEGLWTVRVEAWSDPVATWLHRASVKVPAGLDVDLELAEGAAVLTRFMASLPRGNVRSAVKAAVDALTDPSRPAGDRLAIATSTALLDLVWSRPLRELVSPSQEFPLLVERRRALVGAWYEFFPRSEGATLNPPRSGTFATAAERLPAVAAMGFDVLYLPPIHPIGTSHRKGPNNSLDPGPDDPGSPWAIGSADGGHDAVHPDLGTLDDFDAFVAKATSLGLDIALDLALQASPDHPWVTEHPLWFRHRADGTIAYAENPPKRYQDVYPINFDHDPEGLYAEVERLVRFWMSHGVRIFRVDNPHTKPVWVWQRLTSAIGATDPDVLFLAEAFTSPPMMRVLGEVGFQQSYTYFTWRNSRRELEEYLNELAGPAAAYMRPNFFVNTPDILSEYLQYGGPAAFAIRAALAATLSPTWGVYAGFELFEHEAVRAGSEEYLDSEKYQYRPREWAAAEASGATLAPWITQLNALRAAHPALQTLRGLHFHHSDDDSVIVFSKRDGDSPDADCVVVVVTLDPHRPRETMVHLDLAALGLGPDDIFSAHDLVTDTAWRWSAHQYVRLAPAEHVAHIVSVRRVP
ncbi:MAG: DUF3416 domain-containing protein [Actinobacteria bacterium]|nr:DUF3416 domain-containing protein [Actinomycetota bacterium]